MRNWFGAKLLIELGLIECGFRCEIRWRVQFQIVDGRQSPLNRLSSLLSLTIWLHQVQVLKASVISDFGQRFVFNDPKQVLAWWTCVILLMKGKLGLWVLVPHSQTWFHLVFRRFHSHNILQGELTDLCWRWRNHALMNSCLFSWLVDWSILVLQVFKADNYAVWLRKIGWHWGLYFVDAPGHTFIALILSSRLLYILIFVLSREAFLAFAI